MYRKWASHHNICHTPFNKNTFFPFLFFSRSLSLNILSTITCLTTLLVLQNINQILLVQYMSPLLRWHSFYLAGQDIYLVELHNIERERRCPTNNFWYINYLKKYHNCIFFCCSRVILYIDEGMHHQQQHPVPNNIMGCNHIMQWYWQLIYRGFYFH